VKKASAAAGSNDRELARSTTASAPAKAASRPSPVRVFTPVSGAAASASWPAPRRRATTFEPMSPVPPMTTIFMLSSQGKARRLERGAKRQR
jgi:hypothetical protein